MGACAFGETQIAIRETVMIWAHQKIFNDFKEKSNYTIFYWAGLLVCKSEETAT